MKSIIFVLIFSISLFAEQKQIILGSYAVESNGKRALSTINQQIEKNPVLQDMIQSNSLRTINTEISTYTVVSINAFDSYTLLLQTMKELQGDYPDAYALPYPTKNIANKENLEDVAIKAADEHMIITAENDFKMAELKKLLEEDILESELLEADLAKEEEAERFEPVPARVVPEVKENKLETFEDAKKELQQMQEYFLYIIALALLVLLAAVITVVKIVSNKKTKKQGEDA